MSKKIMNQPCKSQKSLLEMRKKKSITEEPVDLAVSSLDGSVSSTIEVSPVITSSDLLVMQNHQKLRRFKNGKKILNGSPLQNEIL